MSPDDAVEDFLAERFRQVLDSRPWLVVGETDQVAMGMATVLRQLGADDVLALGVRSAEVPTNPDIPLVSVGEPSAVSAMTGIRGAQRIIEDLPERTVAEIEDWDPPGRAAVMVPFVFRSGTVAGRATWGARPAVWEALEDKLVAESIWSAAGIEHERAMVVGLGDLGALRDAHRTVASAGGSVWAGDSRSGWHGGASGVRWVRDQMDVADVAAELAEHHDRVRVMPFLEGVPCSIHGLVTDDGVAVFRPCEMIVLRDRAAGRFEYATAATFWDPTVEMREEMRTAARAVGHELSRRADFRGVFTIDGVATDRGFRPTELNARFGAGAALVGRGRSHLPLFVTSSAVIAGDLDGLDLAAFESWTIDGAEANRQGRSRLTVPRPPSSEIEDARFVLGTDGSPQLADGAADVVVATAGWSAAAPGGVVNIEYTDAMPVGPPVAPVAAEIVRRLDESWGLGLADLEAASPRSG